MVKKQKFLRNLLTSVSVASIIASIGGSSVAFADNAQVGVGAADLSEIWDKRFNHLPTDWVQFSDAGGQLTVDPKSPGAIDGIDVKGDNATITINKGITIGHIFNGGHTVAATINAGHVLTLGKEKDHTGLGTTKLNGVNSTLRLENEAIIHNAVTTTGDGQGVLTFEGAGTSFEAIGTAAYALAEINIGAAGAGAAGPAVVTLKKDVFTKKLNFAVAGREVQIAGNFEGGAKVGGVAGAAGAVDFGVLGGTLTFNALPNQPKTFNSTIVNGDNGTLNVQGNLTATHADIGKINTINIGGGTYKLGILSINASADDVDLLDELAAGAGAAINFLDKNSKLRLYTDGADRTITFHNDLPGMAGGGGIVVLQGTDVNTLVVQSAGGTKTLGTGDDPLDELQVRGNVTIIGEYGVDADGKVIVVNEIDVGDAQKLNIIKGAIFLDKGLTSQHIPEIHIGAEANYILDTQRHDFNILRDGSTIIFDAPDAQLTLRNSGIYNKSVTINNNLEGFDDVNGGGVVLLQSTDVGSLTVQSDKDERTLGIAAKKLNELQVRGNVIIAGMDAAAAAVAEAARLTGGGATVADGGIAIVANRLDVSNVHKLNIIKGAVFTDESSTSAKIGEIHIGTDDGIAAALGGGKGKANYILDAKYGDFGILAPKGVGVVGNNEIIFDDATAQLTLRNSSAAENRTITFHDNLLGFDEGAGAPVNYGGIVSLESKNGGTLFVQSLDGAQTLGTAARKIEELQVRGQVTVKGILGNKLDVGNVKTLNVMKEAIFLDESATSANIANINIGANGGDGVGQANYIIETRYNGGIKILNGSKIAFKAADAQLTLRHSSLAHNRTITFYDNLEGFNDLGVDHGGIVSLESEKGKTLTLKSDNGLRTLGTAGPGGHKIGELHVRGKVIIAGDNTDPAKHTKLDVSNAKKLNVINGAIFTDESVTSAQIAEINIGANDGAFAPAGGVGPAIYIIDTKYDDFTILANVDDRINFLHENAKLILQNNSDVRDGFVTLENILDPDSVSLGNSIKGIVELHSIHAGKTLNIKVGAGGLQSLGTNIHRLKEIRITGAIVDVKPAIHAETITLDVAQLTTQNHVNGDINFLVNTVFTANDNIGNVNFNATAGTITLADGKSIGNVKGDGNNGTLNFAGAGGAGAITGIAAVNFNGAGDVHLRHVDNAARANTFTFKENATVTAHGGIKGNVDFNYDNDNGGTLNLVDNNSITGTVDNTSGNANRGTLTFLGAGEVTDRIGEHGALMAVNFKGAGDVHLRHVGNAARAKTFTFKKNATVTAHGGIKGNVDFNYDNDSGGTLILAANKSITGTVDNTSGNANRGTLIFLGVGEVTDRIGEHNALMAVNFNGAGDVHLRHVGNAARANTFTFKENANVTAYGGIEGNVAFNYDNDNGGTLNLAANKSITGTVDNTSGNANRGTLIFLGAGTVTENIGATKALAEIRIGVGDVELQKNVATNNLNFANAQTVKIGGDFTGGVNFNGGGTLIFNKPVGVPPTTFNSAIANGNNGTLNVQTNLIAIHADIGKIKTINIGTALAEQTLTIDASAGDVALLDNGAEIKFAHIGSVLGLYTNAAGKIITFHDHLPGGVGGVGDGGIVLLEGVGNTLTVQSKTGGETLGIAGNKLATLEVRGQVTILGGIHKLDIHNTLKLDIIKDAVFTDESATSAAIPIINIGEKATYVLDAKHVNNINILAAGTAIRFLHPEAKLTLRNSDNNNKTITLANTLDPGDINKGIVEFHSAVANTTLTIDGVGSLGTKGHELNEVIFSGDGKFKIDSHIYTTNIMLNAHEVELGDVTSDITFVKDTTLHANGHINGRVDFANHAGIINLKADKNITGSVTGANGTLECLGVGSVGGLITNLGMLKAGKGDVTLVAAGNHVIKEIQGNGEQSLIFASGFNLTGDINLTGGQAVGLIFSGDGNISGGVGTHSSVGNIQIIKAGTVAFGSLIKARDIDISGGATAEIVENTTATNIKGGGKVKFNNTKELILDTPISIDTVEVAGTNVKITGTVSGSNIHFSSSDPVTLTLKASSNVNNITAGGNGVHSMALAADFTTTGNIGSESNRLKEIKLLGDHTFSIKGSIYSPILTTTDNSGKVIFNLNDSVAYGNLGEEKLRLADVTFDSNSTVKGDVYSKKITIKGDKTATFAGTEKRTIDVPGVKRSLEKFTYSTQIVSEEINAEGSSKMKFDNAALINAPINGGQMILADNVWFKEEVKSAASVTFAPDKYVILEKNIAFSNIEASQAKIIILSEKQTITGDLTAKDLTMDLGTSQVKYDNTAKLTGELNLRSFYDSSKLAGGNIEIQSNGKLDLSQLDKLVVSIAGHTDISKISDDTKYVLISSVDSNGISTLDPSKITLDSISEQNRFVSWTIDPSNLTLYAKDISKKVLEKEVTELDEEAAKTQDPDSARRLSNISTLLKQLHDVTDKDSDAFKYKSEIGNMDKANADLSVDKLLPGNTNPISMVLAFMVSEAISQVTSQIASRSVNMLPVASGDDDKVTYGVWGSPFYAVGHQEMRKGISGYRSKSVGGIFGFDGLINDDLLVGVAYSKIDTKMSHKDLKFGDKTNGTTNLFSLYGSYKFPSNFFAEAVASYGITDIKNAEGRVVLDANKKVTTGSAVAKYKSTSYSGQLLTGYNYQPSEKLTITPTIGLRYSQFMDDGHVENGTAYQNLTVKKKTSYNKFEGILGLRTATNIQLDQLLLIPELHGYVNYDFKGKSPIIDARLGGMNEPFPTQSVKPTKVSFTVGTGLTVKSNMMEYGVTYNAHIADKYIGHQGSLKVKVNF